MRTIGFENMDIKVIKTLEDFKQLEEEWQSIIDHNKETNFYLGFDWFYSVLYFSKIKKNEINIFCFYDGEGTVGIIPCFIEAKKVRFLKVRALKIIGNIYSPMRGSIVRKGREKEIAYAFCNIIYNEYSKIWDIVDFEDLSKEDLFIYEFIEKQNRNKIISKVIDQFANIITDLYQIKNSDEYFFSLSKKLRSNVNNKTNRLMRDGSFAVGVYKDEVNDIENTISNYLDVYKDSWKMPEEDSGFHPKIIKYLIKKNKIRLFILYFRPGHSVPQEPETVENMKLTDNDEYIPIASYVFIVHSGNCYALKSAYRDDFSKYSPSTVLFWRAVNYLIDIDNIENIDRQKGDEKYKFMWGGEVKETRFKYFAANPNKSFIKLLVWNEITIVPKLREIKNYLTNIVHQKINSIDENKLK